MRAHVQTQKISISPWIVTVKEALKEEIEKIKDRHSAINRAVMSEKEQSKLFSNYLYVVADELFSRKKNPNWNKTLEAPLFFISVGEKYQKPSGFLDKHKRIRRTTALLSEFLKSAIVPLLLFVLWLIFGYNA